MLLETERLTKHFGGVTAVDGVDFRLEEGQLCSVIGPNGAGKTTFFNLLTGALAPSAGEIWLQDGGEGNRRRITDARPHETARSGIHRSYQITNLFPTLSVLENVRLAVQAHSGDDAWRFWRNVKSFESHYEEAYGILDRIGLVDQAEAPVTNLSHGDKRSLEVGVALAGDPTLLLLDEPTAGVSSEGVDDVVDLIENVAADHSVMLIEHNMDVVMDISDRIVVLHRGRLLADGDPEEIRDDEGVRKAYLGGYDADTGGVEA